MYVKREAGEIPARSRHCIRGVCSKKPLEIQRSGKEEQAMIRKSGDLPMYCVHTCLRGIGR